MNITCVYAYPVEVEHLQRRLKKTKSSHRFTWICWRREKGVEELEFKKKPDLIINLGFAGSLNDKLSVGKVALVDEIMEPEKFGVMKVGLGSDYQKAILSAVRRYHIPIVKLLSSKVPVVSSKRKKELAALSGADLVDMEAYWIYRTATRLGIPFISFKVVSDSADEAASSLVRLSKMKLSKMLSDKAYKIINKCGSMR